MRIPAELAYADGAPELTITPHGDVITIFPGKQNLRAAVAELRGLRKPQAVEKREPIAMPDRD